MPFRNSKTLKIELSEYSSYLGRNEARAWFSQDGVGDIRQKRGIHDHRSKGGLV